MGLIYRMRGETEKAMGMFREALRLDPELTVAVRNLEEGLKSSAKLKAQRNSGKTGK